MAEEFLRPKKRREWTGERRVLLVLRKALRFSFALLLICFSLFLGHRIYAHLLGDPFFRLREIEIEGNQRISKETLLDLLGVEGMPNLFTLRLEEMGKRLQSHPWVEEVKVRKVFPDRRSVQVVERRPVAILQLEELYYIDGKGVIFSRLGEQDLHNFPFLTGIGRELLEKQPEEANRFIGQALELLRIAESEKRPPLEEVSEIHMDETFGMSCFTQPEGLEVRMGWGDLGEKVRKLSLIWSDLKKRGWTPVSVNCSDPKRIVVKRALEGEPRKGVTKR